MDISQNKLLSDLKGLGVDVEGTVSRFADNCELYVKFLLRYPDDTELISLKETYAAEDFDALVKAAHKLRGVSVNLGMVSIAEKAGEIEAKAKKRSAEGLEAAVSGLEAEYREICRIIGENADITLTV